MAHRILLVDEHALMRQGLRALLSSQPDFVVIAEAADGKAAYNEAPAHAPDILLMDITLPGMHGLALAEAVRRRLPPTRIVVLTTNQTDEMLREALRIGIDGYLIKDASYDELLMALRSVVDGKKYLSPSVSRHLVDGFLHPERSLRTHSPLSALTSRERSILQLIAEGRSNRTAAEFLSVSTKTVEKHRANLMRKLGLRNAGELLLAAVEMGLIERPDPISRLAVTARAG